MTGGYGRGFGGGMWPNHMMGYGGYGSYSSYGHMSFLALILFSILALIAVIWAVGIKGYALWHAAKRNEKWWFIALLIINTFGLFELVYLIFFAKVWPGKAAQKVEEKKDQSVAEHAHAGHTHTDHSHAGHNEHHSDTQHEHKG